MPEQLRTEFIQRRRPCFECSQSLQYVREKGYLAAVVSVDGIDRLMHKTCAELRGTEDYEKYVTNLETARVSRRG